MKGAYVSINCRKNVCDTHILQMAEREALPRACLYVKTSGTQLWNLILP